MGINYKKTCKLLRIFHLFRLFYLILIKMIFFRDASSGLDNPVFKDCHDDDLTSMYSGNIQIQRHRNPINS